MLSLPCLRLLHLSGERCRGVTWLSRSVIRIGVLELNRNRTTPICEFDLLENLGERIGFEYGEISTLFALAGNPSQ